MTGERVEGRRKQLATVLVRAVSTEVPDHPEAPSGTETDRRERAEPRDRGSRDRQTTPERAERAGRTSDSPRRAGESNEREAHR